MTTDQDVDLRDVEPFRQRLEAELRTAAVRLESQEAATKTRDPFRIPRLPVLAVGVVLLALLASGALLLRPGSTPAATADPFVIQPAGDRVVIQIVDEIRDPEAATAELATYGLIVEFQAVPTSPSLLRRVVSIEGGVDALRWVETNGEIVEFSAPFGASPFVVEYGRETLPGENYAFMWEPQVCKAFADATTIDQSMAAVTSLGYGAISWLGDGPLTQAQALRELDSGGLYVREVQPKAPGELWVFLTTDPNEPFVPCS